MTMKCPHCEKEINVGSLMGSVKSHRKAEASRRNGAKGGKPTFKSVINLAKSLAKICAIDPLSDTPIPKRCQASHCKSYETTQKDVAGCKVWLCDFHSLPI